MARQPVSYPTLGPMEAGQTSLGMIFHPDMALWQSLHTDSAPGTSNTNQKSSVPENEASRTTASNAAGTGTEFLWDKRLHNVNISRWTEVAVSNEFAAKAMSLYLQTDHPLFGLFDADLFLNDLTSGQLNFCSPLLVNALLCWACQAYANFQPEATGLCQRFYLIAKQQWQSNKVHTITAVAASMFLSIAATCLGDDELSAQFLQEGCVMGKSLGLFGASDAGSAKQ
ncbi:hypothetical protein BD289DRAFT_482675 [Coniella lustricola]|uniref:Transcription factor domain-containing protein n=1 Tax=Coniella lustricola TaxID=2025994 RepID=A0A2T3A893_9PEZI|nr:hypothetical protein BD289DRAFT_482675 [Coniella lustricola]